MTHISTSTGILTARAVGVAFDRWNNARTVGKRARWAREQAGLTRREVAEFCGLSSRTLHRIESGERAASGGERVAIARAVGTSIAFLAVDGTNNNGRGTA
jgi:transcriptional regulator with XRE-family HTH domain